MPRQIPFCRSLAILVILAIVSLAGLSLTVGPAETHALSDLPPRPSPVPTAVPPQRTSGESASSFIRLTTTYPATWAWSTYHWQSLPTQVQWLTDSGEWLEVNGWYGSHDEIEVQTDGSAIATKTWWVAPEDYGRGPFRWLVEDATDGSTLSASAPFTLPTRSGQTVEVAVDLTDS